MDAPLSSTSGSSRRPASPFPRTPSPGTGEGSQRHFGGPAWQSATSRTGHSFSAALTQYLEQSFLPSVCPGRNEYMEKEATRVKLENMAARVLPGAKLKPFGSTANGLSLRNSDMDLCCLLPPHSGQAKTAAELVEELGTVIQQETNFMVKMLPRARIPIIKLVIPASPNSPFGMSCDIGFDNKLALQNTRLLLSYVQLDPRVRPLILFIKVWTKRRKINNPYLGTLSSYGYALLVLYFLVHVRKHPVLPNLQRVPPTGRVPLSACEIDGHDVYFFEDVHMAKRLFGEPNKDNLGDLLVAFFQFYSREFRYATEVVSLRSEHGLVSKHEKGWLRDNEAMTEIYGGSRDNNRLCIEDPFQLDYNVARTVTKDGLFTIRGEFMRVHNAFKARSPDAVAALISDICEERADEALNVQPPGYYSNRRRSAPSPRIPASQPPPLPTLAPPTATANGTLPNVSIPQSAHDFRQWVEATTVNGMSVANNGRLLGRSAISESGEVSPTMPPLPPPRAHLPFNPRTMPYRHPGGTTYQPVRRPPPHVPSGSRNPLSPPVLERRLSWDGPTPQPSAHDFNRFFQSPSTEIASMAHTAPASPLFAAINGRGQDHQRGPRSQSHSSTDRRQHLHGLAQPPQAYVNGLAQGSSSAPVALPNYIRFGNFASPGDNGLGLFESPLDDGVDDDDDDDDDDDERPSTSLSSYVESDSDVIVFGDVPVVRQRGPSSSVSVTGDDEASGGGGSGGASRRRSGAVSPAASLPEPLPTGGVGSVPGLPTSNGGAASTEAGARRSSRGSAPPAIGASEKTPRPTLAEHLARLDLADPQKR